MRVPTSHQHWTTVAPRLRRRLFDHEESASLAAHMLRHLPVPARPESSVPLPRGSVQTLYEHSSSRPGAAPEGTGMPGATFERLQQWALRKTFRPLPTVYTICFHARSGPYWMHLGARYRRARISCSRSRLQCAAVPDNCAVRRMKRPVYDTPFRPSQIAVSLTVARSLSRSSRVKPARSS